MTTLVTAKDLQALSIVRGSLTLCMLLRVNLHNTRFSTEQNLEKPLMAHCSFNSLFQGRSDCLRSHI
jgi:hypothetical protein